MAIWQKNSRLLLLGSPIRCAIHVRHDIGIAHCIHFSFLCGHKFNHGRGIIIMFISRQKIKQNISTANPIVDKNCPSGILYKTINLK